jgi:hypothetical protein
MSRWEVAPTTYQRWIAHHRDRIRVGLLLWVALVAAYGAYVLVTEGFGAEVTAALFGAAGPLSAVFTTASTAHYVEKWDREHGSQIAAAFPSLLDRTPWVRV